MGLMKNYAIECEERGYADNDNTVCMHCIGNKNLQQFISKNGTMSYCHYCNKPRKVVTLSDLMKPIMSGIDFSYERAVDCMGVDCGEYVGNTYSTYELIFEELWDELSIENSDILTDIVDAMNDDIWCEKNPYADKEYDKEFFSWRSFCELVKRNIRYVFYKSTEKDDIYGKNPVDILEILGEHVEQLQLTKVYSTTNRYYGRIYRGRMHSSNEDLSLTKDFGPPPYEYAASNRMSAEGIPLFYGAYDEDTVLSEIYNERDECASVASFNLKRPLVLLNLGRISDMKLPSVFNEADREKRSALMFLKKFAEDIARPIDENPNIEYIPTQIVTEYFRHIFVTRDNKRLDGIIYSSAKNPGQKCVALFMTQESFLSDENTMLDLTSMKISRYKKQLTTT